MELYEGLSADDRYRRFFSAFHASHSFVNQWIRRTHRYGFGLVAIADQGRAGARLVGEAGYVLVPNGDGEFAITVAHDWRGWLGPYLLDLLVAVAAARGVPNLEADILTDNRPMQSVVRHRGHVTVGDGDDFTVVRVAIGAASGHQPTWPSTRGRRLLVEVPGGRWSHGGDAHRAGFEVLSCGGMGQRCPALQGEPCPLAEAADVIVMALPPSDTRSRDLLAAHARLHPGVPIVVQTTAKRAALDATGCSISSGSSAAVAIAAVRRALGDD